jgi:hypothetical protein
MLNCFVMPDHPVCGVMVGFAAFFLMPQPPLLYQAELSKLGAECRAKRLRFEPQSGDRS